MTPSLDRIGSVHDNTHDDTGLDVETFGVLGSTGYLGSSFIAYLAGQGERVLCGVRARSSETFRRRLDVTADRVRWVAYDRLNLASLEPLFRHASSLFNFIGVVGLGLSRTRFPEMIAINGLLPGLLAKFASHMRCGDRFLYVHPSTQRVRLLASDRSMLEWMDHAMNSFAYLEDRLLNADDPIQHAIDQGARFIERHPVPRGRDPYDVSKLLGELYAARFPSRCVVRISSVYGPSRAARGLVQRVIETLVSGRHLEEPVAARDFLYEEDLNEILRRLPEAARGGRVDSPLDAVSGNRVPVTEVVQEIETLIPSSRGSIELRGTAEDHPQADNRAAAALLGCSFVPLKVGLRQTVVRTGAARS